LLLIMSMLVLGIGMDRLLALGKGRRQSLGYLGALQPLVGVLGRLREALGLESRWKDAPVARIIGPGITDIVQGLEALGDLMRDPVELELLVHDVGKVMERAKKREMAGLQRGLPMLATIASSAPFVGLFGTVFGIITAFQQMADPSKGGGGGLAT